MRQERLSDQKLFLRIGGVDGLTKVVAALEDVCLLGEVSDKIGSTSINFSGRTDLRLGLFSDSDTSLQRKWKEFARIILTKPSDITHTSLDHCDDNVNLIFKDLSNWQAVALRANGFDPEITLGKIKGKPFISSLLDVTEEGYLSTIPGELAGLTDYEKIREEYWFGRTIGRLLRDQFLEDPLGYLKRYRSGLTIFNNSLMSINECDDYTDLIATVALRESRGGCVRWRSGDGYPQFDIRAVKSTDCRGLGNPEGDSLLSIRDEGYCVEQKVSTPILVVDNSEPRKIVGSTLIQRYSCLDGQGKLLGQALSFGHISSDLYKATLQNLDLQREMRV